MNYLSALQEKYFQLTPPDHKYVPWVLVDGTLSEDSDDLLAEVCKAYTGVKPDGCPKDDQSRCSAEW